MTVEGKSDAAGPVALAAGTAVAINPRVVSCEVAGEAVLLDLESGTYFGLDPVGTRIWALLGEGLRLGEVHRCLLGEYEVTAEQLWRDLEVLVGDLVRRGLVTVDAP